MVEKQELLTQEGYNKLEEELEEVEGLIIVGLPLEFNQKLYNTAAVISGGKVLGFVPKHHLPNYAEFYEARHFTSGKNKDGYVMIGEEEVPFGTEILFNYISSIKPPAQTCFKDGNIYIFFFKIQKHHNRKNFKLG